MYRVRFLVLTGILALVLGCANKPLAVDAGPTPEDIVAGIASPGAVHWGGRIVKTENLRDTTRIEILAFPLSAAGEPMADRKAQGRFIVEQQGFLEPREYAPDRRIEVRGTLRGFRTGSVGDAPYRYPLVAGDRIKLWPEPSPGEYERGQPRVNFGFGFGSYGSGAGIGIGF
jgi:outer membrane lipoprotein